jgi:hypothetical protein
MPTVENTFFKLTNYNNDSNEQADVWLLVLHDVPIVEL